jgi:selenocysteine-specific elongation factor
VSATTGEGLDLLKQTLADMARNVTLRDDSSFARLPIDRAFSMKGFGTVVTGTLLTGRIQLEDEMEIQPGGARVRVRGVQVHGQSARFA